MRRYRALQHVIAALTAFAALAAAPLGAAGPATATAEELSASAAFNNSLAWDLYRQLQPRAGDVLYAPFGIDSSLMLIGVGAADSTLDEIKLLLHMDWVLTDLLDDYDTYRRYMQTSAAPGAMAITASTSLWIRKDIEVLPAFLQRAERYFSADVRPIDFARSRESAAHEINHWVEQSTKNRIFNLVPPSTIDPGAAMIVVNALYLQLPWEHPFPKSQTRDQPFFSDGDRSRIVPMMSVAATFDYAEDVDLQMVALPYAKTRFSMEIILPKPPATLAQIEHRLLPVNFKMWHDRLAPRAVHLFLPRFRTEGSHQLAGLLQSLGLRTAFDPSRASFPAIASAKPLFLSQLVQKAFISVDENGSDSPLPTGASAVAPPAIPADAVELRADRPFVFVVRERATGALFFVGRYTGALPAP